MNTSNTKKDPQEIERLKEDPKTKKMTEEVAKAIVANRLVILIGAGFAMNLDLPPWGKLVEFLCNKVILTDEQRIEVMDLVKYGYFSDALERIAEFSNYQTHKDELRGEILSYFSEYHFEEISEKIKNKHLAYKYLSELYRIGAKKIVTTNYDNSLEECLNIKDVLTLDQDTFNKTKVSIIEEDKYFLKLHGGLGSDMSSMVLFEGDYRNKYILDEQIPNLLQELFIHNRILFLGCGLSDRYMDIYERLKYKKAVMDSYVICTPGEHMNVSEKTGINRIKIKDYCYLDVILEMILEKTRKIQQEKCKKILFSVLPLENYDYTTMESFFSQISNERMGSCYFFNTQVELSAWFSPALQIYLTQQMKAYSNHKDDDFMHYRILFLPFDKSEFASNLEADNTFKQDVKAMIKLHKYMNCRLAFITTDVLQDIIEKNNDFFNDTSHLIHLGLKDYPKKDLDRIIQEQNKNGYRKTQDLDFAVILPKPNNRDDEQQIWQANYEKGPNSKKFVCTSLKESQNENSQQKFSTYKSFSGIIIDYLKSHDDVFDPKLNGEKLRKYLKIDN